MSYVDLNTIHNPATGNIAPAAWGDQVRDNQEWFANSHDHSGDTGDGGTLAFGLSLISKITLGSPAAQIQFGSIPGTYQSLLVVATLRPANNGVNQYVRINGITSASYDYFNDPNGAAAAATYILADVAVNNNANYIGPAIYWFPDYTNAYYKGCQGMCGMPTPGGTQSTTNFTGTVRSTSVITSIQLLYASGNVDTGSTATLYGVVA